MRKEEGRMKVDEVSVREEKERKEYKEKQCGKADRDSKTRLKTIYLTTTINMMTLLILAILTIMTVLTIQQF